VRSRTVASGLALVATAAALALPAASADAGTDTIVSLPALSYVHQVLVDDSAGYVFISEGNYSWDLQTSGGGIVVTNLAGSYVTTLDAGDAAEGMALSGGTLYAALDSDGSVAAIDVSTISEQSPTQTLYSLGSSGDLPYDLALQSGELWVSYGFTTGGFGAIGEIDLTSAVPAFAPAVLSGPDWYYAPDLAADPADNGFLAAAVPNQEPTVMATYDIADGATAPLAQTGPLTEGNCESEELGIAVAAGGQTFGLICNGYPNALAFTTASLDPDGTYGNFPDGILASAVAVAPDGTVALAASGGTDPGTTDIGTFTASGRALNLYQSAASPSVMTNGLAWSADGSTLYAVLVAYSTGVPITASYSLEVIDNAATPPAVLTLTGPSRSAFGSPIPLSGAVTIGTGAPPAGSKVTITRTASGQAERTFTAVTTATGAFTFKDRTDPIPGTYTYTASYDGVTSAGHTVTVVPAHPAVAATLHGYYATIRHGSIVYRLYRDTARVSVAVRVGPARPGDCVRLQLQEYYRGDWRNRLTTACGALNQAGDVTESLAASREAHGYPYRIRALFLPGTDTAVTAAQSSWLYFEVAS
jgi:hypothetical protein